MNRFLSGIAIVASFFVFSLFVHPKADASHSWGGYHWARTANPFTLKLGDNLTSPWKSYLATSASDWTTSDVLDLSVVAGGGGKNCKATSGRVEMCNRKYGNNGWLGLAQIWISGSHIVQGVTKMNDTYFNTSTYNTPGWKQMVMCQEVGHTLGLDHQDEAFTNSNLGTCMDYTNNPTRNDGLGNNLYPNAHDFEELGIIYAHLDATTTVDTSADSGSGGGRGKPAFVDTLVESRGEWGRLVRQNGRLAVFERDFGGGNKLFTFVIFAD